MLSGGACYFVAIENEFSSLVHTYVHLEPLCPCVEMILHQITNKMTIMRANKCLLMLKYVAKVSRNKKNLMVC